MTESWSSLLQEAFSSPNADGQLLPSSYFMDSFLDEILKDAHTCTHTHTCNPPNGPDYTHTHTCFHVHTKILPGPSNEDAITDDTAESTQKTTKKRPLGNRAAVRKYREKKKAQTASLEEEIHKLRAINQQLMKRLQSEAVLEAEIARLKCLLVDFRGRIDGEIGSFPYQRPGKGRCDEIMNPNVGVHPVLSGGYVLNSCDLRCEDQLNCLRTGVEAGVLDGQRLGLCEVGYIQCPGILSSGLEFESCGRLNDEPTGILSCGSKKKSVSTRSLKYGDC